LNLLALGPDLTLNLSALEPDLTKPWEVSSLLMEPLWNGSKTSKDINKDDE
jgi:hypothetical protein